MKHFIFPLFLAISVLSLTTGAFATIQDNKCEPDDCRDCDGSAAKIECHNAVFVKTFEGLRDTKCKSCSPGELEAFEKAKELIIQNQNKLFLDR